jgi:diguanylate cyclase (GGDEF)-like protein
MSKRAATADTGNVDERSELRRHVARVIAAQANSIINDALGVFPYTADETGDADFSQRVAELLLPLMVAAVRTGEVDARSSDISDLRRLGREKQMPIAQLFQLAYLLERSSVDHLALDESSGATSEPWPAIAQMVRRASLDLLAAFAERLSQEAGEEALTDALTRLHTRAVVMAALEKELQRAVRFGRPFALILFDVDRLAEINLEHGYGVGDRVLERIGIVLRNYFREQDWVSRCAGDKFAVLLPETAMEHAERLADRVRLTVQDRLALPRYRSHAPVAVTVSVAVVMASAVDASIRSEQVMREAEQAVHRAKHGGRNRVELVEINVKVTLPPPIRDARL